MKIRELDEKVEIVGGREKIFVHSNGCGEVFIEVDGNSYRFSPRNGYLVIHNINGTEFQIVSELGESAIRIYTKK